MVTGWRIVRRARAGETFTGEGARRFGGRWNSPGAALVYTSDSLALAALETLAHLNPPTPLDHVCFELNWPKGLMTTPADLPPGWHSSPAGPASQRLGDRWIAAGTSAVLAVPSTLIPSERNFLLNPGHADFPRIIIGDGWPFGFDSRLLPD